MTRYLMSRDRRREKRRIYSKALTASQSLADSLRDMRDFANAVRSDYEFAASENDLRTLNRIVANLENVDLRPKTKSSLSVEDLLRFFLTLSEEI